MPSLVAECCSLKVLHLGICTDLELERKYCRSLDMDYLELGCLPQELLATGFGPIEVFLNAKAKWQLEAHRSIGQSSVANSMSFVELPLSASFNTFSDSVTKTAM